MRKRHMSCKSLPRGIQLRMIMMKARITIIERLKLTESIQTLISISIQVYFTSRIALVKFLSLRQLISLPSLSCKLKNFKIQILMKEKMEEKLMKKSAIKIPLMESQIPNRGLMRVGMMMKQKVIQSQKKGYQEVFWEALEKKMLEERRQ